MTQPKSCLVPMGAGSEDIEAITTIDVLRRGGVEVTVASVMPTTAIKCSNKTNVVCDCLISDCRALTVRTEEVGGEKKLITDPKVYDCIALPGGIPGADHLRDSKDLIALLHEQNKSGRLIAAICASPAVVLSHHRLLLGKRATCYPSFAEKLKQDGVETSDQAVVVSDNFVTSRGPATAMAYALTILKVMGLDAKKVADGLLFEGEF